MIRCDAHMHTRFSEDSDASVHSMLDAAIERGMKSVCITDHLDKDFPQTPDFPAGAFLLDLENYFQRLTQLKEEYQKKLDSPNRCRDRTSAASGGNITETSDREISV